MLKTELALEDIKALGFDVEELAPQLFVIKNFITAAELESLYEEVTSYSEEDWDQFYLAEMRIHALDKFGRDDLENMRREGLIKITKGFYNKVARVRNDELRFRLGTRLESIYEILDEPLEVSGFVIFQRLYEATELKYHYDQQSDKLVAHAGVLYLNDDYTKGELFFPGLGINVTPEPGSLVIFPGTKDFEHGVRRLGAGPVRYVLPAFIKSKHPDGSMAGWAE